jgi:hypothetical protein
VSDNRGGGRDSHAPLGHGRLPLGASCNRSAATRAVGAVRGTGRSITLELDCRRYLDDRSALVGYLRQERQKCLALLDGASPEEVLGRPDVVTVHPGPARTTPTSRPSDPERLTTDERRANDRRRDDRGERRCATGPRSPWSCCC